MNRVVFCFMALLLTVGALCFRAQAQAPAIQLGDLHYELQYTVGDENSDVFFQSITSAAVGPNGQMVIADQRSDVIVAYSAEGEHQWTIDASGQGPGELNRPSGLSFRGETLMFSNQRGTRVDSYSSAGSFERSFSFSELGIERAGFCGWLDPSTAVLTHTMNASYGNHLYVVDWDSGQVLAEREFRLPGVEDPPPGFNIGTGCKVMDGAIFISHAYADGFWKLTAALEDDGFIQQSGGNFLPPILTRLDSGNLSALFPMDVEMNTVEGQYVFTNVRWPCDTETVEEYQSKAKAGDEIPKCRTQRLIDPDRGSAEVIFEGPANNVPYAFIHLGSSGWLIVQPQEEYPMAAVYRRVN